MSRDLVTSKAGAQYRGAKFGLPPTGSGSLAPAARRIVAFIIDLVAAALVASLFVRNDDLPGAASHLPGHWSLVPLVADYVLGLTFAGRTFGMYLTGLRVIRLDRAVPVGLIRAVGRTVLLVLLVPAVVIDSQGRGLHDRFTATAVIVA